jgi:hypothetical protein
MKRQFVLLAVCSSLLASCGADSGRLGTFIADPGDAGTWTVWRPPGSSVVYLTKHNGNTTSGNGRAPGRFCVIDTVLRLYGPEFAVSNNGMPYTVRRFSSPTRMWTSLARDSAEFAFTRSEVQVALRRGHEAPKPAWVKAFERGCMHARGLVPAL